MGRLGAERTGSFSEGDLDSFWLESDVVGGSVGTTYVSRENLITGETGVRIGLVTIDFLRGGRSRLRIRDYFEAGFDNEGVMENLTTGVGSLVVASEVWHNREQWGWADTTYRRLEDKPELYLVSLEQDVGVQMGRAKLDLMAPEETPRCIASVILSDVPQISCEVELVSANDRPVVVDFVAKWAESRVLMTTAGVGIEIKRILDYETTLLWQKAAENPVGNVMGVGRNLECVFNPVMD